MISLFLLVGCNFSYIVDLFVALHELASASARTLLKLASSVRARLKPYWATLTWRQDTKIFPARWMLIGQFKFPARQPYARLYMYNRWRHHNVTHHKRASQKKQNDTLNAVAIATRSASVSFCPKNNIPICNPWSETKDAYLEQTQLPYCLNSHQFSVFTSHGIKTKIVTIQWTNSRILDTIDDWYINNLAKNQVSAVFHSRVICRRVSPKFL